MRVVMAFDVDGTLETTGGPVTIEMLDRHQRSGAVVVMVSSSALRPPGFPEYIKGDRTTNLRAAREAHPADLYLYISDNEDRGEAEMAGFTYIDRYDFR